MSDRARLHCRARAHTCVSRLLVGSHACHYGMRVALRAPLGERVALPCCRPRGLRQGLIGAAPWGGTRVAARPWVRACGSTRAVGRTCGPSVLPPTRVAAALLVRPRGVALGLRRARGCVRCGLGEAWAPGAMRPACRDGQHGLSRRYGGRRAPCGPFAMCWPVLWRAPAPVFFEGTDALMCQQHWTAWSEPALWGAPAPCGPRMCFLCQARALPWHVPCTYYA